MRASDLVTAPLAVLKRLERIKKAVEIIGTFGSIYAMYEDINAYDPTADPYEMGQWLQTDLRWERSSRGHEAEEDTDCGGTRT